MRFPEVFEAVTFPNLDEVLVRRCAHHGVFPLPPRSRFPPSPLFEDSRISVLSGIRSKRW